MIYNEIMTGLRPGEDIMYVDEIFNKYAKPYVCHAEFKTLTFSDFEKAVGELLAGGQVRVDEQVRKSGTDKGGGIQNADDKMIEFMNETYPNNAPHYCVIVPQKHVLKIKKYLHELTVGDFKLE